MPDATRAGWCVAAAVDEPKLAAGLMPGRAWPAPWAALRGVAVFLD